MAINSSFSLMTGAARPIKYCPFSETIFLFEMTISFVNITSFTKSTWSKPSFVKASFEPVMIFPLLLRMYIPPYRGSDSWVVSRRGFILFKSANRVVAVIDSISRVLTVSPMHSSQYDSCMDANHLASSILS